MYNQASHHYRVSSVDKTAQLAKTLSVTDSKLLNLKQCWCC